MVQFFQSIFSFSRMNFRNYSKKIETKSKQEVQQHWDIIFSVDGGSEMAQKMKLLEI